MPPDLNVQILAGDTSCCGLGTSCVTSQGARQAGGHHPHFGQGSRGLAGISFCGAGEHLGDGVYGLTEWLVVVCFGQLCAVAVLYYSSTTWDIEYRSVVGYY